MIFNSIRNRMTLAFSAAIALLMFLACWALIRYAQRAAEVQARTQLRATSQKVYDDLTDDEHQVTLHDLVGEEREMLHANGMALAILGAQGHIERQSQQQIPSWPHPDAHNWRVATLRFGDHTIVIGLPWHSRQQQLHNQAALLLALGSFVTVIATLGAWLLVGRTLSPIDALARQAQAASAENLNLRLTPPSEDIEIVHLVSTLNGLLARISDTVAARGRFHAAASHELRTPLQALSGYLELALSRKRTSEEYEQLVEEANTYAQRLTSLTQDLLLLHQLDAARPTAKTQVDLVDICARMMALLAPLAQDRGLQVRDDMPQDAELEAPPTHADMLIRNLLENAYKYASPDGTVLLHVSVLPGHTQIDIYNDCAPLGEWRPERLFEPFYRPDASRHSSTGGTGLGLAICKAIATANGWTLTLRPERNGVTATAIFPTARV